MHILLKFIILTWLRILIRRHIAACSGMLSDLHSVAYKRGLETQKVVFASHELLHHSVEERTKT